MMIDNHSPPLINVNGSIGIVNQKPWILNDTVKNNIVLKNQYNHEKYIEAVNLACLADDIKIFHNGDMEVIGEKGATISGGQKTRISLARIFYSDCDIMLFDDILNALDMHIGNKIVSHALTTRFKSKTRVIATHSLNYLKYADRIVMMENGSIKRIATYQQLSRKDDFLSMVPQKQLEDTSKFKKQSNFSVASQIVQQNSKLLNEDFEVKKLNIVNIYKSYFHYNGGLCFNLRFGFILIVMGIISVIYGSWLNTWGFSYDYQEMKYPLFCIILAVTHAIAAIIQELILTYGDIHTKLYSQMVIHLLYAPIHEFYDIVPVARIINRIAKDVNHIDTAAIGYSIITSSFISVYLLWLGLFVISAHHILLIPFFLYFFFSMYIIKLNIEILWPIFALEHNLKSSVISICTEILNGIGQLKAYQKINVFLEKNIDAIDRSRLPLCPKQAVQGWYQSFSRILSIFVQVLCISLTIFVFQRHPNQLVLFITSVFFFQETNRRLTKYLIVLTQHFYSITRCQQIVNIPTQNGYEQKVYNRDELIVENNQLVEEVSLGQNLKGSIKFDSVCLKYQDHLPAVLKSFSVEIQVGDKIAVLGKTGSGKSTIFLALLKLLRPFSGQIYIDGIALDSIPLQQLRNNMSVIMQDNVLFKGTLRQNLDPLSKHSDKYLLQYLQMCKMKDYFIEKEGLETEIQEGGSNLSAGQRQILTIIRSILEPKKIVLIDEATANIDANNEKILIDVLNKRFKQSTILSIMHKLDNLYKYKKVMIIKNGQVEHFDTYERLKGIVEQMYSNKD